MTKSEINKAIAKLFGFEVYRLTVNGVCDASLVWRYPEKFQCQVCSDREKFLPDFVAIIEKANSEYNTGVWNSPILKKDYGSYPETSDLE